MLRKLIMYISAFLPMFVIMWVKEVLSLVRDIVRKPHIYPWNTLYCNPYLISEIVIIILIGGSICLLLKKNKKTGVYTIAIKSLNNRSAEYYLTYYSLFILALIGFSLTDFVDLIVLFLLLIVLGVVYIKNGLFFMNPTINIFQSYIYNISYDANGLNMRKLIISPEKLVEGDIIDIDISEFEFTFFRRKHEA